MRGMMFIKVKSVLKKNTNHVNVDGYPEDVRKPEDDFGSVRA